MTKPPPHLVGPIEQGTRILEMARRNEPADLARGHGQTRVGLKKRNTYHGDPETLADLGGEREIARTLSTEPEVLSDHDQAGAKLAKEGVGDERFGQLVRTVAIKGEDLDASHPFHGGEQLELVLEAGQHLWGALWTEQGKGMAVQGEGNQAQIGGLGQAARRAK